ncbi:helix-turn-helix domain-containing protein [Catenulispora rubra]|uniref:helix-turn-helix domain-containing protein n=1 Tax=Catenulispora rubra TaxID=280293 RepID=UPI0018922848
MTPLTNEAVQQELELLTRTLTVARKDLGDLPQRKLASMLGVAKTSVVDWETGQDSPTVRNLIGWARILMLRLVIVDRIGVQVPCSVPREHGETWETYELRRLTMVLRDVRNAYPMLPQLEVANRGGFSRVSLVHWESLRTPPRTLGLIRWAMALDCRVRLAPMRPRRRILATVEG